MKRTSISYCAMRDFAISAMANSTTGYEKRRLETNHWRQITQGTACSRAAICRSGRRFCLFEFNFTQKNQHTSLKLVCCSFFYLIEPLSVPYELRYDERLGLLLTMRKYFPLPLNRRILRPRYVEYPHPLLYCGW